MKEQDIIAIDVEELNEWDEELSDHLEYEFDEPNEEEAKGSDE